MSPSQPLNASVRPFGSLIKKPKWQISPPFHLLQLTISLPFHVPESWKRYPGPFMAEPPCKGHFLGSTPRGIFPGESCGSGRGNKIFYPWLNSVYHSQCATESPTINIRELDKGVFERVVARHWRQRTWGLFSFNMRWRYLTCIMIAS